MTAHNHRINDTGRTWDAYLIEPDGTPANLAGKTVVLWKTNAALGTTAKLTCTVVSETEGHVSYQPLTTDVSVAGRFKLQWKATDGTGKVSSYPNTKQFELLDINPD